MVKNRLPHPVAFHQQMIEAGRGWSDTGGAVASFRRYALTVVNWVGQAAIDKGKPPPGREGSTAEREELNRPPREYRRLQIERDILAKATVWFAARGDKAAAPPLKS